MNRKYSLALVIYLVILGTVPAAIAVTEHNFVMGFEVGDQFHYSYSNNETGDRFDFYVEIDTLPIIGEDIDEFHEIYGSDIVFSYYSENETEFNSVAFQSLWWGAMPIGNWSFLQALYENYSSDDPQFINTTSDWGFYYDHELIGATVARTQEYSKTDGTLSLFETILDRDVGITRTIQIARKGTGTIIDLYLIIAGVAAVVVIVAIAAVVMKRR